MDAVEELEEGLGLNVELETLDDSLLKHWMGQRVEVESLFGVNLTSDFASTMEREVIVEKDLKLKAADKKIEFLRKQVEELTKKVKEETKEKEKFKTWQVFNSEDEIDETKQQLQQD